MKTKILICLIALLAVAATNVAVGQFELPKVKLTVKVLDEAGNPFHNAEVQLNFQDPITHKGVLIQGNTDVSGLFTKEGNCNGMIGGCVQKSGYYMSGFPFKLTNIVDGKWLPWNPTCVTVLRPIGKPVALYAKTVHLQLPALEEPCGFDLEASDWVTPFGKGLKQDFIFIIHEKWNGNYDFDLQGELTFKNALDGLQETSIPEIGKNSVFRWERQAPENGYNSKQELRNAWFPDGFRKKPIRSFKKETEWEGYFFRIQTVEQDGKIVSAHYGKIRGGIKAYPDSKTGKPNIVFTYYYNPTPNDRNLEWDTKQNLFGGLSWEESPREP